MQIVLLYATVVLIWGSTWSAIPFQLGVVAEELSVAYRFGIAALFLYAYALLSRRRIRLPANAYPFVFLQGTLLFSLNYFLVYYATVHITSGLVAALPSATAILRNQDSNPMRRIALPAVFSSHLASLHENKSLSSATSSP